MIGKPVAIIADAKLSGRADTGAIVERLLNISGEDVVDVNRKNKDQWTGKLPTRLMMLANELPRLPDQAVRSRVGSSCSGSGDPFSARRTGSWTSA